MKNTSFLYEVIFFRKLSGGGHLDHHRIDMCAYMLCGLSFCSRCRVESPMSHLRKSEWDRGTWFGVLVTTALADPVVPKNRDNVLIMSQLCPNFRHMTLSTSYSHNYGHEENPSNHPSLHISTWEDTMAWRPKGTFICTLINLSVHKQKSTAGPSLGKFPLLYHHNSKVYLV